MKKIIVNWEKDNEETNQQEVEIPDDLKDDEVADYLSNKYGWLVKSWS